jgi:hypothetical protein
MKKTLASIMLLSILISTASFSLVVSQSTVTSGSSSVSLRIIQPENATYYTSSVKVTVTAHANPGVINVAYSLDGGNLTYFGKEKYLAHNFNDTFWLYELEEGLHRIDVQAGTFAHTSNGLITAHSSATFLINTKASSIPTINPTIAPTENPTLSPVPTSSLTPLKIEPTPTLTPVQESSDFSLNNITLASMAIVIAVIAVASILLVYFKRRKGKT